MPGAAVLLQTPQSLRENVSCARGWSEWAVALAHEELMIIQMGIRAFFSLPFRLTFGRSVAH